MPGDSGERKLQPNLATRRSKDHLRLGVDTQIAQIDAEKEQTAKNNLADLKSVAEFIRDQGKIPGYVANYMPNAEQMKSLQELVKVIKQQNDCAAQLDKFNDFGRQVVVNNKKAAYEKCVAALERDHPWPQTPKEKRAAPRG